MKRLVYISLILVVGSFSASAQETDDPYNRAQAAATGNKIESYLKSREAKWKLKQGFDAGDSYHLDWKSGSQQLRVSVYVYDDSDRALKMLQHYSRESSVAGPDPLPKFGDEAYQVTHRYFSWVLVRTDRTVLIVRGPPDLNTSKRFAQEALAAVNKK